MFFQRKILTTPLKKEIRRLFGFVPSNLFLYEQALLKKHAKTQRFGFTISNERLEFLGDSILNSIVSTYLFKRFPRATEGELTIMKNRLINRQTLNLIGHQIGLTQLLQSETNSENQNFIGNALEAFIAALYLDKGYKKTEKIITNNIFSKLNIDNIISQETNYKSKLIEWCQKNKFSYDFKLLQEFFDHGKKNFVVEVYINDLPQGRGIDMSIKAAQQKAAKETLEKLNLL
ncbi:MAG: ribonuclease III [Bacteroidales bacterium]|nr:ribonuclease III [Bacteroidales bacterium]